MFNQRWEEFEKHFAVGNDGSMSFDEEAFIKSFLAEPAGGEEDDDEGSFEGGDEAGEKEEAAEEYADAEEEEGEEQDEDEDGEQVASGPPHKKSKTCNPKV